MISVPSKPVTFLQHPSIISFRELLQQLFDQAEPERIADMVTGFLRSHPLPLDEFPRIEGTYSRTIVHRHPNGYEAMAARWSKGTLTSIHGHPPFLFYHVISGGLKVDNFIQTESGLITGPTMVINDGEGFHAIGEPGRYDNSIHQVHADEETLSIHIFSDNGQKGEVFASPDIRNQQEDHPSPADIQIPSGQLALWRGPMELLPVE